MSESELHKQATNRFIDLANDLKNKGMDPALVNGAMMTASSIYATYVAAGNHGALEPGGVDKVVDLYRRTLEHFQQVKRAGLERDANVAGESDGAADEAGEAADEASEAANEPNA